MSELTQRLQQFLSSEDDPCLHDQGRWFSKRRLRQDVGQVCGLLSGANIQPGDRVLLGYPNGYAFAAVYLAAIQYGAVVVPVSPDMPAREFRAFLLRSRAVCAFLLPEHCSALNAMEEDSSREKGSLPLKAVFSTESGLELASTTAYRRVGQAWEKSTCVGGPLHEHDDGLSEPADSSLAVLLYTSGTTGRPKAVGLSHRQILLAVQNVIDAHRLTEEDITYCFLPLFHINAQVVSLLSTCLSGGRIVLAAKFSASRFWTTVSEHRVTWVSAVPAVIGILLHSPPTDRIPDGLRFVRSASSPLPPLHMRRFERKFGVPVIQSYGMSEAASQICVNPLPPDERRLGSVGLPVGVELAIVDENGHPLKASRIGEIVLRGSSVIERYVEAENQDDFREGWFHTGDLGYVDEEGYVYITGRRKEMINRAGEKISPYEVEDVIRELPHVRQVAVIGLPDPLYGEQVAAFIVTDRTDEQTMAREVKEHCRSVMSAFKCPATVTFVAEIPSGATGKVQRGKLKQKFGERQMAPTCYSDVVWQRR